MIELLSDDDAKHLVELCKAGRLYDVEEWIRSGRSLGVSGALRKTPLSVAIETKFHSLIELLLRHEESQATKNQVLARAVQLRRIDLAELAIDHGAEPTSVPFVDVLLSWDKQIVRLFLDRGADLITDVPFAHAFQERVRTALGCFLDCKRSRPELAAGLQEQADISLRGFCREGNLKWVSLLMWAGADPRSRGPTIEYLDDPEMVTTALEEASSSGHIEILKRLKPDPNTDDLGVLLQSAGTLAHVDVISYLLGLGASPNDKANGGSSALDGSIRHLGWEDFDAVLYGRRSLTSAHRVHRSREAIRLLIEHGALWKPGDQLNDARRVLCKIEAEVTVELVGRLLRHSACDDVTLHLLLRTPHMRSHMASCESRLARIGLTLDGRRRSAAQAAKDRPPSLALLNRYDRKQLHAEVWAEPTQKVARRYGMSDVALAKVCRQLRIPKPPRGYWAKKVAGVAVPRRPNLPPLDPPPATAGRQNRS